MHTIIIQFENRMTGFSTDVEIPLGISADAFVKAMGQAFHLDYPNGNAFLRAERPVVLIKGACTLMELGLHEASCVYYLGR